MSELPQPPANILQYIVAIVMMLLIGVVAIVVLQLVRPDRDNMTLHVMISGFVATMTTSLLALLKSQETHLSVNSRLDQFMKTAKEASRAEGILEGQLMPVPQKVESQAGFTKG